jgi:DNA-binding transcriptional ArsR family regulator
MMPVSIPATAAQLKVLGHPVRLRLLAALAAGELCVCQLTALLDLATSTASEHLAELRTAGLVTERKEGRWVHYRLVDPAARPNWLDEVLAPLARDPQVAEDRRRLRALRAIPLEDFCRADRDLGRLGIVEPARRTPRPAAARRVTR